MATNKKFNGPKLALMGAAAASIMAMSTNAGAVSMSDNDVAPVRKEQADSTRTFNAVLRYSRESNIRIINSDKYYQAYYLDTDNDVFEDYIAFQVLSESGPKRVFAEDVPVTVTEVMDSTGRWIVKNIEQMKYIRLGNQR